MLRGMTQAQRPARNTEVDRRVEHAILALQACREEGVPMRVSFAPPLGTYDARAELEAQERTVTFTVRAVDFDSFQARLGGGG